MRFSLCLILLLASITAASTCKRDGDCSCASAGGIKDCFLRQILDQSPEYGNFQHAPTVGRLNVGIIGAGAAGLYAAMILENLGVDYEILEGSD